MKRTSSLVAATFAGLLSLSVGLPGPCLSEAHAAPPPMVIELPSPTPAAPAELADYERRERAAPAELAGYTGGSAVIIGTTAAIVILAVVVLLIAL
jgi:hypothetical protein